MSFEDKIKLLKKLKAKGYTDLEKIKKMTTHDMLIFSEKKMPIFWFLPASELQDNTKDLYSWLMKDPKEDSEKGSSEAK